MIRGREELRDEVLDREAVTVAARFLGRSVSVETLGAYERSWEEFSSYVQAEEVDKDPYQVSRGGMARRLLVVIRYCQYLHRCGKRDEQVGNALRGIRFHLECRVCDAAVFSESTIERAKTACQRTLQEALALRDNRESRRKVCVPREVMLELRRRYWSGLDWSWDNALLRLTWLGLLFGRVTGLRPSNWTLNSKKRRDSGRDHNLKMKDFRLLATSVSGGELEISCLDKETMQCLSENQVLGVRYRVTTKTTKGHVSEGGWRTLGAGCDLTRLFLSDVWTFAISEASGLGPDDYVFAVRRKSTRTVSGVAKWYGKVLQSGLAASALKAVGATLGIPPQNLSLSSVRRTYATVLEATASRRAGGGASAVTDPLGNWAAGSRVPSKHYSQMSSIGEEAVEGICELGDVTIEDVRRVLGSDLAKVGGAIPDAHKRIGIVSSNPGKPDSDDSSSEGGSEDGDPQTLDRELRRLYEGEGKSM